MFYLDFEIISAFAMQSIRLGILDFDLYLNLSSTCTFYRKYFETMLYFAPYQIWHVILRQHYAALQPSRLSRLNRLSCPGDQHICPYNMEEVWKRIGLILSPIEKTNLLIYLLDNKFITINECYEYIRTFKTMTPSEVYPSELMSISSIEKIGQIVHKCKFNDRSIIKSMLSTQYNLLNKFLKPMNVHNYKIYENWNPTELDYVFFHIEKMGYRINLIEMIAWAAINDCHSTLLSLLNYRDTFGTKLRLKNADNYSYQSQIILIWYKAISQYKSNIETISKPIAQRNALNSKNKLFTQHHVQLILDILYNTPQLTYDSFYLNMIQRAIVFAIQTPNSLEELYDLCLYINDTDMVSVINVIDLIPEMVPIICHCHINVNQFEIGIYLIYILLTIEALAEIFQLAFETLIINGSEKQVVIFSRFCIQYGIIPTEDGSDKICQTCFTHERYDILISIWPDMMRPDQCLEYLKCYITQNMDIRARNLICFCRENQIELDLEYIGELFMTNNKFDLIDALITD